MFASYSHRSLLTVAVAVAVVLAVLLGSAAPSSGASSHSRRHMVRPGETLWGIASAGYPNSDPREAVYQIEQANHLSSTMIDPGQVLVLP